MREEGDTGVTYIQTPRKRANHETSACKRSIDGDAVREGREGREEREREERRGKSSQYL